MTSHQVRFITFLHFVSAASLTTKALQHFVCIHDKRVLEETERLQPELLAVTYEITNFYEAFLQFYYLQGPLFCT